MCFPLVESRDESDEWRSWDSEQRYFWIAQESGRIRVRTLSFILDRDGFFFCPLPFLDSLWDPSNGFRILCSQKIKQLKLAYCKSTPTTVVFPHQQLLFAVAKVVASQTWAEECSAVFTSTFLLRNVQSEFSTSVGRTVLSSGQRKQEAIRRKAENLFRVLEIFWT
jgi:hypothetical protein